MIFGIENFFYDPSKGIIKKNGNDYALTSLQKKLFEYFLDHPNEILSKDQLMRDVWNRIVTENTISKFISVLRNMIEDDPANPKIILTHFGHGFSFSGQVKKQQEVRESPSRKVSWFLFSLVLFIIGGTLIWVQFQERGPSEAFDINFSGSKTIANKKVLILPLNFIGDDMTDLEKQGLSEFLQSTYHSADNEGQVIVETDGEYSHKHTIEKFWQIDKQLVVLQSNVVKNGEIYEAVMQLSLGPKVINKIEVSADNLNELVLTQMNLINSLQSQENKKNIASPGHEKSVNDIYISALGYLRLGNTVRAKEVLHQALQQNEKNFEARLQLAKLYIRDKEYEKAIAELKTLKASPSYNLMSAEIELTLAKVLFEKHEYNQLIDDLIRYQASHLSLGEVKKSRIKIQVAKSYLAQGNMQEAMKFFKQSVLNIDERLDPELFAQSYYGQGMILLNDSNDKNVLAYFEKALEFAKSSDNLELQVVILDEMAKMLWVSNQPDKGIELKKQAVEIMGLVTDKSEVAKGLGTLAGFLIQSGRFSEAKKVNDRLGQVAEDMNLDSLFMNYLHYDAVILMNLSQFDAAAKQISKQLEMAVKTNNHVMQLDNAFIEFEFRLATRKTDGFLQDWQQRTDKIKELGFERYQVYMDYYLARYYKIMANIEEAEKLFNKISEQAKSNNDIKILVDAQNELADMYIGSDAKKSLEILQSIEQYNPNVNPYLEIKARTLNELGKKIEALSLLNQAKLVFHEGWKAENEILLQKISKELNQ